MICHTTAYELLWGGAIKIIKSTDYKPTIISCYRKIIYNVIISFISEEKNCNL